MLRVIFVTLISMFCFTAKALTPSDTRYPRKNISVAGLYEACGVVGETKNGDIPYFDCESYVYGVLDAYSALKSEIPLEKRACFPDNIPPWEVLEVVRPLILKFEASDNKSAGPAIIAALKIKYPCSK